MVLEKKNATQSFANSGFLRTKSVLLQARHKTWSSPTLGPEGGPAAPCRPHVRPPAGPASPLALCSLECNQRATHLRTFWSHDLPLLCLLRPGRIALPPRLLLSGTGPQNEALAEPVIIACAQTRLGHDLDTTRNRGKVQPPRTFLSALLEKRRLRKQRFGSSVWALRQERFFINI